MAPSGETGSRLLQGGPSGLCGGWPGYMLWGTYLGLGRDEVIRPLERTLWGVFRYRNNFFFGRTVLGKRNGNVCIIVRLYIIYIYTYICIMTISYINNMSKFIFVTCIYDTSICLLIFSIHTFVCLLFCLSKAIGFPKLVNSSQVKPVDMYFFQKASQMNSFMSSTIL